MSTVRKRGKKKYRFKPKFFALLIIIMIIPAAFLARGIFSQGAGDTGTKKTPENDIAKLNVLFTGDIVMHRTLVLSSLDSGGDIKLDDSFSHIKDEIDGADIAVTDFEGTLGSRLEGYPRFQCQPSAARALADLGFDLTLTANNHANDFGHTGIMNTIKYIREAGMKTGGTRARSEEPRYAMFDAGGIKTAIVPFTFCTGSGAGVGLNSLELGSDAELVNYFEYDESGAARIAAAEKEARDAGADVLILYLHWGTEYEPATAQQKSFAEKVMKATAFDCVIGSHPHVVQEYAEMENKDGKKIPVYYAIGNLLTNQREEIVQRGIATESGFMVNIDIEYDKKSDKLISLSTKELPYWVDKYSKGGQTFYRIVPLYGDPDKNSTLEVSGHAERAEKALEDLKKRVGRDLNS